MPWCTRCDRFLSPPSVRPDGSCPACGESVEPGPTGRSVTELVSDADAAPPLPWHFKLFAGAVALYLGYRAFQGIEWIVARL